MVQRGGGTKEFSWGDMGRKKGHRKNPLKKNREGKKRGSGLGKGLKVERGGGDAENKGNYRTLSGGMWGVAESNNPNQSRAKTPQQRREQEGGDIRMSGAEKGKGS